MSKDLLWNVQNSTIHKSKKEKQKIFKNPEISNQWLYSILFHFHEIPEKTEQQQKVD